VEEEGVELHVLAHHGHMLMGQQPTLHHEQLASSSKLLDHQRHELDL